MATRAISRLQVPRFAIAIGSLVGLAVLFSTRDGGPIPYVFLAVALLVSVYRYVRGPAAPWYNR